MKNLKMSLLIEGEEKFFIKAKQAPSQDEKLLDFEKDFNSIETNMVFRYDAKMINFYELLIKLANRVYPGKDYEIITKVKEA